MNWDELCKRRLRSLCLQTVSWAFAELLAFHRSRGEFKWSWNFQHKSWEASVERSLRALDFLLACLLPWKSHPTGEQYSTITTQVMTLTSFTLFFWGNMVEPEQFFFHIILLNASDLGKEGLTSFWGEKQSCVRSLVSTVFHPCSSHEKRPRAQGTALLREKEPHSLRWACHLMWDSLFLFQTQLVFLCSA